MTEDKPSALIGPLFEVRKAILNDASMTKDLEEQIDNVSLAEKIARRPSYDQLSLTDQEEIARTSKPSLTISGLTARSNTIIEPIPSHVVGGGARSTRHSRSPHRRQPTPPPPVTTATGNAKVRPHDVPRFNGNGNLHANGAGKVRAAKPRDHVEPGVGPSKLGRYQSLLTDVDPMKRTRGSLTPSSDSEHDSPITYDGTTAVDPVSFSASGATVASFATQTPEEMNSSDSEHTDDEPDRHAPVHEPSSSTSSDSTGESSSEESWDSEADEHTSASEDDPVTVKPGPNVVEKSKNPLPTRVLGPPAMPWLQRPTFTSMQFPASVNVSRQHPRRGPSIPTSQSFPQDFFRMVSNPFFTTSLHDAYRQACAFKEWYELNFPEQIESNEELAASGAPPIHQLVSQTTSSASATSSQPPRRSSEGARQSALKMHAQV